MSTLTWTPDAPGELLPGWRAADVAAADAARLATGVDLMAVAAHALAGRCAALLRERAGGVSGRAVVLLVGPGNNGGDALLAGASLRRRGAGVTALLLADRAHEGGVAGLRAAGGRVIRPHPDDEADLHHAADLVRDADLVVDGVLGIGARGAVRGAAHDLLERVALRGGAVVACDLPSGLDPDTGALSGPVLPADVTVTFGAAKAGLLLPRGRHVVGELVVVDLGLEEHLPDPALHLVRDGGAPDLPGPHVAVRWPRPWRDADKYARGVLGVAAGDDRYPGAAVLACSAAAASGVGMVRYVPADGRAAAVDPVGPLVLRAVPELLVQPLADVGRVQAWVVGPGVSEPDDPRVRHVLEEADEPAVVDAGALQAAARLTREGTLRRPDRLLLTPHRGELERVAGVLGLERREDAVDTARDVVARTGAVVLLKGADTVVLTPEGRTTVVPGGPPWLATAGAGDVLAGVAGALLAAGTAPGRAATLAAHVHAVAAHRASRGGPLHAALVADEVRGVVADALGARVPGEGLASGGAPVLWDDGARD
ncbi:NAD(P)H-hydrate dehydratase [Aquipuribacter nitratireducens]|uniref:Bifunctional NAD(P)H-hydrate repair enzyme n=1 Tax=Aquipuribacter nitratireducens TaxID=650104 RepID=A0ABW0GJL7_9MICO